MRDVKTVKGVLAYLYAFLPQEDIAMDFKLFDYNSHTQEIMQILLAYLNQADSQLSTEEKAAVKLQYFDDYPTMTDQAFKTRYGFSRSTHKNRLKRALVKLNTYLSQYFSGMEESHGI